MPQHTHTTSRAACSSLACVGPQKVITSQPQSWCPHTMDSCVWVKLATDQQSGGWTPMFWKDNQLGLHNEDPRKKKDRSAPTNRPLIQSEIRGGRPVSLLSRTQLGRSPVPKFSLFPIMATTNITRHHQVSIKDRPHENGWLTFPCDRSNDT